MEELKKYDLFDRYLRGELDQKELNIFLERLESDEVLKKEFEIYQYLVEGIREHEKQELKAFMAQKKKAEVKYIGSPWSKTFTYASAAVLIGFGLLYVVLDNRVKDQNVVVNEPVTVPKIPDTRAGREKEDVVEEAKPELVVPKVSPADLQQDTSAGMTDDVEKSEPKAGSEGREFPVLQDQKRMASNGEDDYPVKEDSRIMDTLITLSILFEHEDGMMIDTGTGGIPQKTLVTVSEKILVQFWKSPINYKGYRFDGRKLVLFGLDSFSQVELKYLIVNNELKVYDMYLVYGKMYVKLIDNNRYNPYIRETNPAILNELK